MADLPQGFTLRSTPPNREVNPVPQGFTLRQPEEEKKKKSTFLPFTDLAPPQIVEGIAEAGLTLATGTLAQITSGLQGGVEGIIDFIQGKDDVAFETGGRITEMLERRTFQPRSEFGQKILKTAGKALEPLAAASKKAGDVTLEKTGSPAFAALVHTGVEILPDLLGLKGGRSVRKAQKADIQLATESASRAGVDVGENILTQRGQVIQSALEQTGDQVVRGQELETVRRSVESARNIERARIDALYAEARGAGATISTNQTKVFPGQVREALSSYPIKDMPRLQLLLDDMDKLFKAPKQEKTKFRFGVPEKPPVKPPRDVDLDNIALFQQTLSRRNTNTSDLAQNAAIGVMRGMTKNFLDTMFNTDMIKGSPEALAKWKGSNRAFAQWKKDFDEDSVIRQLGTKEATPEELKQWIFGANAVGAKTQAGSVVAKIKKVVGEDSPAFGALRQEALFDIMEPLLRENPDFAKFHTNYDTFVRKNPTLAAQLFPDSISPLGDLRKVSAAVDFSTNPALKLNIVNKIVRSFLGHGIAKGAVRIQTGLTVVDMVKRAAGTTTQRRVMADLLGYDPTQPFFPKAPIVIGGVTQTLLNENERNQQ